MRGGLSLPKEALSGTWEPETPMRTEKSQVQNHKDESTKAETQGGTARSSEKSSIKGWSEGAVSRSLFNEPTSNGGAR